MTFELKPFRIGPIQIALPVVLAPMAGYTDLPFRLLCRRFGAGYCTTEMMLDKMILLHGKLHNRMMAMTEQDHPLAGQIIGNEPDTVARAAEVLAAKGFDVIDLNFACPVRKALSRRRGGHMLTQAQLVGQIIRAVVAAAGRPVTVKLRQKFQGDHDEEAFWAIADQAVEAGVAAITVHGRSVEAKYRGMADWNFLAAVKQRYPDRTIIGSGDVLTPIAALRMLEQTKVDAAAVARGALGNPWFFRQVQDLAAGREPYRPSIAEQRALLTEHFNQTCQLHGPMRGPKIMRKHNIKYARMHPTPSKVRVEFVLVKNAEQWQSVLDRFYGDAPADAAEGPTLPAKETPA